MKKYHHVKNVRFEDQFLLLKVDGREYRIDLGRHSKQLAISVSARRQISSCRLRIRNSLAGVTRRSFY